MGKSKKMHIYAHFGQFPIILKQNMIFQTILLVITALCNVLLFAKRLNISNVSPFELHRY